MIIMSEALAFKTKVIKGQGQSKQRSGPAEGSGHSSSNLITIHN